MSRRAVHIVTLPIHLSSTLCACNLRQLIDIITSREAAHSIKEGMVSSIRESIRTTRYMGSSSTDTDSRSYHQPWGFGSSHSHRSDSRERNQQQKELVHAKDASIGVKVVYTPPEGIEATVDIVAVHGLIGDAFRTWTVTQTSGKEIFWLRDMLPSEVPNARVLTYGYDSDPGKMFDSASTNMVHHHATTLVSELHYFRRVRAGDASIRIYQS